MLLLFTKFTNNELDEPIYLGFSTLDLCRFLMYEFHYKYIKVKYDNCVLNCYLQTQRV